MTRSSLRHTLAALAASSVLALAGCGVSTTDGATEGVSSGGSASAAGLHEAARTTAGAETMRMAMDVRMTGIPGAGELSITAEGRFDEAAGRGSMTMDMGSMLAGTDDDLPAGAGKMDVVVDGDTFYVRSPLYDEIDPSGKPWKRMEASDIGTGTGGMGAGAASDPGGFVSFLEAAGTEVTTVGTEEVRGVATTHVKADLELADLLRSATGERKEALEDRLAGLGLDATDLPPIPAEAWIDDDDLVRKVRMTFDLAAMGSSMELPAEGGLDGASMTVTMELYDLGEPVDVVVPDPSEVSDLDLSALAGMGGD